MKDIISMIPSPDAIYAGMRLRQRLVLQDASITYNRKGDFNPLRVNEDYPSFP